MGRGRVKLLATLAALLCAPVYVGAHSAAPMVFDHVTLQDGLSQATVTDVLQDSQGFLWIGTESGLNRYDGYRIETYSRERGNPQSLANDFIWEIAEDAAGDIWVTTDGGGVARWHRNSDTFSNYHHDDDDPAKLSSDKTRAIMIDTNGRVWIGTRDAGISVLDPEAGTVERLQHDPARPDSLASNNVMEIIEDRAGAVWIGTDAGLDRYEPDTGTFVHYRHDALDPDSLSDDTVISIHEDRAGVLWIGTFEGGLNSFSRGTGRFRQYRHDPDDASSLAHDYVRDIVEDEAGHLWVGTEHGLNFLDRTTGRFARYGNEPSDPFSIQSSFVMSLYQDRGGILWVGTRGGGLSKWNPRSWSFGHHRSSEFGDSILMAFADDGSGGVWVGTLGSGLLHLDLGSGQIRSLDDIVGSELSDTRAMSLLLDQAGVLWVGTMTGGLNRVDPATGRIEVFRADPSREDALSADGIMSLYEDRRGRIWIGTFGGGLNMFDKAERRFYRYGHDSDAPSGLGSQRVTAIVEDLDGLIWAATDGGGLYVLDSDSGEVHSFRHDPDKPLTLSSDSLYAMHVDISGNLWVGTAGGGLDRVVGSGAAPEAVAFENLNKADGLVDNVIYGIQSDRDGRLWMSTNNGLMRYDQRDGSIRPFHQSHGLQDEEFNFGAHHRAADGRLYFGGVGGFNVFEPREIEEGRRPPAVVLTSFETLNAPAETAVPHPMLGHIDLSYRDSVVTFEFAALDYVAPEKNRYSYMLEGFDDSWIENTDVRRVTYTNLYAGKYTFRVRARSSDGVASETELAIPVSVSAAPWRTAWAYALYAGILLALIFSAFRWQRRRLESEATIKQLAYYDQLTGLPNGKLFRERLSGAIAEAGDLHDGIAVLYVDLDHFQRINDSLGHGVGDSVLNTVASRLVRCLHAEEDSADRVELARLGGDEFIIYLRHPGAAKAAEGLAERIMDVLGEPLVTSGHRLSVGGSIGISVFPSHGKNAETLLKNADTAVHQAKQAGRKGFVLYSQSMGAGALARLELEGEIQDAIQRDLFQLYYQPKFCADTLKIVGAEALLRWFHPTRGEISPGYFIPIAEEAGLILDIGRWVTTAACRQIRAWQDADLDSVPVAINLSGEDFYLGDPVSMIRNATRREGVSPELLHIELTESVIMRDVDTVQRALDGLKKLGCLLSIDDFGTGYSSLAYLRRFPLDALKIDRSFVRDIASVQDDDAICAAIIAMAKRLGLSVVAEGVETENQLRRLRAHGCDQVQGYLLGRPVPADLFMEMLSAQRSGAPKTIDPAATSGAKVIGLKRR